MTTLIDGAVTLATRGGEWRERRKEEQAETDNEEREREEQRAEQSRRLP